MPEGPSATYLGVNNGVSIVQPDVVINEDVVNVRIMGVYPQGLPTLRRELISGPPETVSGEKEQSGEGEGDTFHVMADSTTGPGNCTTLSQRSRTENVLSCCPWPRRNEAFCIKVTNQGVFGEKQEVYQGMGASGKV